MTTTKKKSEGYTIDGTRFNAIRNSNEPLVLDAMRKLLDRYPDFCGCDLCMQDVYAAALNNLPPRYAQEVGINLQKHKMQDSRTREAEERVAAAILKVSRHPSH